MSGPDMQQAIGMMSGTSGDGVDVALIEARWTGDRPRIRFVAHHGFPFSDQLRERVLSAGSGAPLAAADLARLHAQLGDAYAEAVGSLVAATSTRPAVIGVHGQTVAHLPDAGATLQLGDASRVALRAGIPTVSDFRSADVAAGGQGAPLTPFADHLLFADRAPCAVLNLGGIANLTLLPNADPAAVRGWDSGPANMLLDGLARMAGQRFDSGGERARRGRVIEPALAAALRHPYFSRPQPKSTGREQFGDDFARTLFEDVRSRGGTLDDALATAVSLVARTVGDALRSAGGGWREVLVAGGGTANAALMEALASKMDPIPVRTTDGAGIPALAREAVAFAILALCRLRGLPNTLPACTGASRAVSAGAIHSPIPTLRSGKALPRAPVLDLVVPPASAGPSPRSARRGDEAVTEARNPRAAALSSLSTRELLELMNDEDATVPAAVRAALPEIERAVEAVVGALRGGGRLRYAGAGTSGRLGVLDASEAPPTFGVGPDVVRGLIAGGEAALRESVEGAEDDESAGRRAAADEVRGGDVLVGISASGRARYVLGALGAARDAGARTVALTCDADSPLAASAEITIALATGPEILAGSTRLKAGTATKLVLNMLTTAAMVRLGRSIDDLMADLRTANEKLRERAVAIVASAAKVPSGEARARLERAGWDVRRALQQG